MASHPNRVDPPSCDMTAATERQRDLETKIAAFLAKGGEIQAFDPQRRPIEAMPWSAFQVSPQKAKTQAALTTKAEPKTRAVAVSRSQTVAAVAAEPTPKPVEAPTPPAPAVTPPAVFVERVVDTLPAPKRPRTDIEQSLRALRKQAEATRRLLDRLGGTR